MQIRVIVMCDEKPIFDDIICYVKTIRLATITANEVISIVKANLREEGESANYTVSVLALSDGRIKYLDMLTCESGKMVRKKVHFDANGGKRYYSYEEYE